MSDGDFMLRAIDLAEKGRGAVGTNPLVGAMVVRKGRIVGRGWHARFGGPHAEAVAISEAGEAARGATLYVTMDPCNTTGKTPPCARAIVASGIRRVVVGHRDPSQRGGGVRELRRRGIRVDTDIEKEMVRRQNEVFFEHRRLKRPVITLKLATTLDGRIADREGRSKWISSKAARKWTRELRDRADAIMIGVNTASADDPELLAPRSDRNPLRVIVDAQARTSPKARLIRSGRVLIAAAPGAAAHRVQGLELAGAEVWRLTARRGRVDLRALVNGLYSRGVASILCEGGGRLAGSLLDAGLIDGIVLVLAPKVLGDARALPAFSGRKRKLGGAVPWQLADTVRVGGDIILQGRPLRPDA